MNLEGEKLLELAAEYRRWQKIFIADEDRYDQLNVRRKELLTVLRASETRYSEALNALLEYIERDGEPPPDAS